MKPRLQFRLRTLLIVVTAALVVGIASGCDREHYGAPIDLVLPKGFSGPVWIVLDPTAPTLPLVSGRYRVVIPKNGLLHVGSFSPFGEWHSFSVAYDDGTPLVDASGSTGPVSPKGIVALRGGDRGTTSGNGREIESITYFVGTESEFRNAHLPDFPPD